MSLRFAMLRKQILKSLPVKQLFFQFNFFEEILSFALLVSASLYPNGSEEPTGTRTAYDTNFNLS